MNSTICSPEKASALVKESIERHTNLLFALGGLTLAGVLTAVAIIFVYPDEVGAATAAIGNALAAALGG